MSLVRVQQTAQVTLTHLVEVDEVLTDAAAGLTATVKRLDGTAVAGPTLADHPSTGKYTYPVPAHAALDMLTVDFTGTVAGAAVVLRDWVEVVGGFYFGLAEARNAHKDPLRDVVKYPTVLLAAKRIEVEQECERICGRAFVPRFARVAVTGRGRCDLLLPSTDIRALRAVSVAGVAVDITGLDWSPSGVVARRGGVWPTGQQIIVEYEYGLDTPPEEIRTAAILRLRSKVTQTASNIPDRAMSWTPGAGGVYRLSTPSAERTGVPDVDAVYERYSMLASGFA